MDALAAKASDYPFEHLSLQAIADLCGISLWALRWRFGTAERLLRAVALYQMDRVARQLADRPRPGGAVADTIATYAAFVAQVMAGRDYRCALYFVLRNGQHHKWLASAYERRIVGAVRRDLEEAVVQSGAVHGMPILLKDGAAKAFHNKLETDLVLATLLPPFRERSPDEVKLVVAAASRDAFSATYMFAWSPAHAA